VKRGTFSFGKETSRSRCKSGIMEVPPIPAHAEGRACKEGFPKKEPLSEQAGTQATSASKKRKPPLGFRKMELGGEKGRSQSAQIKPKNGGQPARKKIR